MFTDMSYLTYNRMHTSGWICTVLMSKTEKGVSERLEAVYPNICKKNVAYLNLGKTSLSTRGIFCFRKEWGRQIIVIQLRLGIVIRQESWCPLSTERDPSTQSSEAVFHRNEFLLNNFRALQDEQQNQDKYALTFLISSLLPLFFLNVFWYSDKS